jgi:threonine/homoserine/homoserine lactone efflux protein
VETTNLVALAGATLVLAATPGPAVLACVSRAITSGFRRAALLTMGIILGDLVFLILAIYGLAALAKMFEPLFLIARYGGGIYLIWQGLRM